MELSLEKKQKSQELIANLISKCWEDDSFKKEFILNPAETIKELTGQELSIPENAKFVVVDQSSEKDVYINIPSKPTAEREILNEELTELELELISAGCFGKCTGNLFRDLGYELGEWLWG